MKNLKMVLFMAFAVLLVAANNISVQAAATDADKKIAINSTNFKGLTAFAKKQDTDGDGYLSMAELSKVFVINNDTNNDGKVDIKITGLGGIEHFPNVSTVSLLKYSKSTLTIPKSASVRWLTLYDVNTKSLKINAPGVQEIKLSSRRSSFKKKLKKLDISNCSKLVIFDINYATDYLTQLKLPKEKSKLRSISLCKVKCSSLDLSKYKNLQEVIVLVSSVKTVNLSKCKKLLYVYFYRCDKLKSVKVNKASKLRYLNWYGCKALKRSGIKTAGKGKIGGGTGMYWLNTKKYNKFIQSLYQ